MWAFCFPSTGEVWRITESTPAPRGSLDQHRERKRPGDRDNASGGHLRGLTGGRALWQHCACPRAEVAARPEQSAEAPAGGVRGSVSAAATGRPGTEALSRAGRRRTAGGAVRRGEEAAAVASAGEGRWEGGLWRRDGAAGAVELGGEVPAGPGSFPSGAQPGVRLWLRRLPAGGGLGRAQRGERGGRLGGRRPLWSRGRVLCAAGVEAAGAVLRLSLARCERMKHGGRQRKQA